MSNQDTEGQLFELEISLLEAKELLDSILNSDTTISGADKGDLRDFAYELSNFVNYTLRDISVSSEDDDTSDEEE